MELKHRKLKLSASKRREFISNNLRRFDSECKICFKPFDENNKYYIDHCHQTNELRGLLCFSCNVVLGHIKDRTDILTNMISYLNGEMWDA